jgi:hypothetical protein
MYNSKAFETWKENREGQQKLEIAVIDRLDALAKQVNQLGNILVRK